MISQLSSLLLIWPLMSSAVLAAETSISTTDAVAAVPFRITTTDQLSLLSQAHLFDTITAQTDTLTLDPPRNPIEQGLTQPLRWQSVELSITPVLVWAPPKNEVGFSLTLDQHQEEVATHIGATIVDNVLHYAVNFDGHSLVYYDVPGVVHLPLSEPIGSQRKHQQTQSAFFNEGQVSLSKHVKEYIIVNTLVNYPELVEATHFVRHNDDIVLYHQAVVIKDQLDHAIHSIKRQLDSI